MCISFSLLAWNEFFFFSSFEPNRTHTRCFIVNSSCIFQQTNIYSKRFSSAFLSLLFLCSLWWLKHHTVNGEKKLTTKTENSVSGVYFYAVFCFVASNGIDVACRFLYKSHSKLGEKSTQDDRAKWKFKYSIWKIFRDVVFDFEFDGLIHISMTFPFHIYFYPQLFFLYFCLMFQVWLHLYKYSL